MEFRKLKEIFFMIGAVLASIESLILLGVGVMFTVFASPVATNFLLEGVRDGTIRTDIGGTAEEIVQVMQSVLFPILAGVMFFLFALALAGAIFCFIGKKKESMAFSIVVLVLGAFTGDLVLILGGAFGLLAISQEKQEQNKQ